MPTTGKAIDHPAFNCGQSRWDLLDCKGSEGRVKVVEQLASPTFLRRIRKEVPNPSRAMCICIRYLCHLGVRCRQPEQTSELLAE